MNHAVSYQAFRNPREEARGQQSHELYDAVVASVSDINQTLPARRKLVLDVLALHAGTYELRISQSGKPIHTYEVLSLPNPLHRFTILFTLGFIEPASVQAITEEIESRYEYGENIIEL